MSAYGYKQTSGGISDYVCFTIPVNRSSAPLR